MQEFDLDSKTTTYVIKSKNRNSKSMQEKQFKEIVYSKAIFNISLVYIWFFINSRCQ